jgi:hypothetical protein
MNVYPAADFVASDFAHRDAMLIVPHANDALPSPKQWWKTKIVFGLLVAGVIATILWCAFLSALLGLLAWSFF